MPGTVLEFAALGVSAVAICKLNHVRKNVAIGHILLDMA